jgi:hypothetical protein
MPHDIWGMVSKVDNLLSGKMTVSDSAYKTSHASSYNMASDVADDGRCEVNSTEWQVRKAIGSGMLIDAGDLQAGLDLSAVPGESEKVARDQNIKGETHMVRQR